jgi:hypothetical protein
VSAGDVLRPGLNEPLPEWTLFPVAGTPGRASASARHGRGSEAARGRNPVPGWPTEGMGRHLVLDGAISELAALRARAAARGRSGGYAQGERCVVCR